MKKNKPIVKTEQEIQNIRESGKFLTELLYLLKDKIKPGISLVELEKFADDYISSKNIKWAFKGYMWYPANLCLSVNNCVVHWIPDSYILKEWDLLKIDAWIDYKWWISDAAISIVVGWDEKNKIASQLYKTTKKALDDSLKYIKIWKSIIDFSFSVYNIMLNNWFSIIKNLTWHWVWRKVHEPPHIYNYPNYELKKIKWQKNMVVALEPITAIKSELAVERKWIPWNMYTQKWDLWAQWEYTVLISDNGYEILAGITNL